MKSILHLSGKTNDCLISKIFCSNVIVLQSLDITTL